jgi:hypothetical protein
MSKYKPEDIQRHMRDEQRRNKPKPPLDPEKIKRRQEIKRGLRRLVATMSWQEFESKWVIGECGAMPGTPEHAEYHSFYLECQRNL